MSDDTDKTEDATPRRLRRAIEQGDSGVSAYAAQAVAFVAAAALAPSAVRALAARTHEDLRRAIARAAFSKVAGSDLAAVPAAALATELVSLVVPLLAAVACVGAVAHLVQTGGLLALKRLTPDLERLNPVAGIKGLFSASRAFAVVRALLGGSLAAALAYAGLRDHVADVAHLAGHARSAGVLVAALTAGLAWRLALAGLLLAALDVAFTRRAWRRRLRMSKDEVRREYKDAEGDPQLKAARERAHAEMMAHATIANVRTASVVVVNPTHLACALRYDEKRGDEAPVVVANGEGDLAARIVQAAHDHVVPVLQDIPLAHALAELQTGDVIPEALYEAVAEILRLVLLSPR